MEGPLLLFFWSTTTLFNHGGDPTLKLDAGIETPPLRHKRKVRMQRHIFSQRDVGGTGVPKF